MAEARGVWGIDIGQAGLKAIRLRYAEAADQVVAIAFDYVPHPKILSQPDAVPEELIPQALDKFLSRNDVEGDVVVISVPGHSALARFIQLPPVESSKVAEIVKYEARQQIPFALEEVIWDYQTLGGGTEESGYMLEAEVGLFAMKRDQVMQQLRPFMDNNIEVELIQIAPLALYNFLSFDRLGIRSAETDEDELPGDEYQIVMDMGADNTTLVVSNGTTIWIRNVPIGGNHFTRALTKEMKLTFAKAEHLKCNATKSPDPRAVFQALRPVFNDYVSEIQRSIGYFSSVNREAKITKVLGVGNGFKLAGLQKFLQQNLQYDVERVDSFPGLAGDAVLNAPLFEENILTFTVPYGLALQGLDLTRIHTTLLPPEIATERKIRRKKPWAVLTAAVLMVGFSLSMMGNAIVAHSVSEDRFGEAQQEVKQVADKVNGYKSEFDSKNSDFEKTQAEGLKLLRDQDQRSYWLEVYKAINECLPRDVGEELDNDDLTKLNRISLISVTAEKKQNLKEWYDTLRTGLRDFMRPEDKANPPEGEGYVFTLYGNHFHHDEKDPLERGITYVRLKLLNNLKSWTVKDPQGNAVPVRKLGVTHATMQGKIDEIEYFPNGPRRSKQRGNPGGGFGVGGQPEPFADDRGAVPFDDPGAAAPGVRPRRPGFDPRNLRINSPVESKKIKRTTFSVQFVWKPIPKAERLEEEPVVEVPEGEQDK